ncbi:cupin domain-containing protein [Chitinophaga pinensis]|uniref:Cupin domain-containing protein n=1 Tax=Chitinophaga pinensis TaxID=79329 RepID=A0A5C6LK28_9BACT|nr:cupin domain-containing protein [Chitinophaga pinensis]TWV91991.1 cupin domain-containing protein [Chitinophaga pinensis]
MKILLTAIAVMSIGAFVFAKQAPSQQPGTKRTELQRHDLDIPGKETIQARIDFDPGAAFGMHTHPGEEIIYVLDGTLEYEVEGKKPVQLKAGDVLFIPTGVKHAARNVGKVKGAELATYVVEKGKPLVVLAK